MILSEATVAALRDEVPEPGTKVRFRDGILSVPSRYELDDRVGRVDHVRLYAVFVGVMVEIQDGPDQRTILIEADPSEIEEVPA